MGFIWGFSAAIAAIAAMAMPHYSLDPDGDDDERCPPNFTDDSDTITDDDDCEESEA